MPEDRFDKLRFGVGQPVPRKEDPKLLRGQGQYSGDVSAEGQVYLAFAHAPYAHGEIVGIDTDAAREAEGVLGLWTGVDLAEKGYRMAGSAFALNNPDGSPMAEAVRPVLPVDRTRFVGEPLVCIAALTEAQALDAAELVEIDITPLPAVTDAEAALSQSAPELHSGVPRNLVVDYRAGNPDAVHEAQAQAAHVVRLRLEDPRVVINPMEMRACLADYDPARQHFSIHTQTQGVFPFHVEAALSLGVDPSQVTVTTGSVGGSFGMRIVAFPEQICALHAARELGRPVKWVESRSQSFMTDYHGRANRYDAALALDTEGRFLGLQIDGFANLGAWLNPNGLGSPTVNIFNNVSSMYRLPALCVGVKCAVSNTPPVGAYRGAGRQAANYIMERMIDHAAAVTGFDRITLRRINQLQPDELPYPAASGMTYDVGEFTAVMDAALDAADVAGFPARREESLRNGKLRGLGIGCFLEVTSLVGKEYGKLRFDPDGDVTFITGTLDFGQGHASTFAQILGERLGIPFDSIRLSQGNSDDFPEFGGYTGGSRSVIASGNAAHKVAALVEEKALQLAGWALETSANDITICDGRITVTSTGQSMSLIELARRVRAATDLPAGLPRSLDSDIIATEGAGATYPNGCHVCEVEIDKDTGVTRVVRYHMTNDVGQVVNPLLLAGQCHGGVAQGIGQALMERVVYDEEGQMLSGSLTDYCLPRADDLPDFDIGNRPVITALNPVGAKGVGESGCAGSLTSVMNAVADALAQAGAGPVDMPATPEKVWRALNAT
jgi:carbon-monoxide dehydrogenase large subunit|tara:strand:- start:13091 stop:15433 length:2343 start_codon:yes stop_codon:yes gene_type:complete